MSCCAVQVGLQVCCTWLRTYSFLWQQVTVGTVMDCIDGLLQRCAQLEVQRCRTSMTVAV